MQSAMRVDENTLQTPGNRRAATQACSNLLKLQPPDKDANEGQEGEDGAIEFVVTAGNRRNCLMRLAGQPRNQMLARNH